MYNKKTIKKYKGTRVKLTYSWNGADNSFTGIIIATTNNQLIFKLNGEDDEIRIFYNNIRNIEKLKSFASYERKIKQCIENKNYQKAYDIAYEINENNLFGLPEQIKIIKDYLNTCKLELFANYNKIL